MSASMTIPPVAAKPGKPSFTMPASIEYRRWLAGFARSERSSAASLIDRLVADHAASRGYPAPPPRHARD